MRSEVEGPSSVQASGPGPLLTSHLEISVASNIQPTEGGQAASVTDFPGRENPELKLFIHFDK